MANKSGIKLLVFVAVVAAGYFAVTSALRPVAIVQVAAGGKIAKAVSAQIKVRAEKSLELKADANGRMMNDLVEGQAVAKGEAVVLVDARQKLIDIEAANIEIESKKAQDAVDQKSDASILRRAKEDLLLKEIDNRNGRLSDVAFRQAADQVEQLGFRQEMNRIVTKAQIDRLVNGLKAKELERDNLTVKAPFDGTITNLQVATSALISPGQMVATLITNTRVIEARISEENMAKGVEVGQRIRVWFTGIQKDFAGTVKRILPAQDPQTLRYIAHLDLPDIPADKLEKTGLSGEGVITIDEKMAKVVVPQRALYNNRLYVVQDGKVMIRIPKLGYVTEELVEILSGLAPDEEVIVDNQDLFREGQRVRTQRVAAEPDPVPPTK